MLLVGGNPGVGKTLALRRFTDSLNENIFRPVYTQLSTLKGADLLRHINERLGLQNRASKAAVYAQIQEEILDSKEQRGRTVVLIIDEAHLLKTGALQELRLLTNFKMDSFDPFILILAGHIELRRTMDLGVMEDFAQRLALRYLMPPLSPDETAAYVRKHMKLAGAPDPIFTDNALLALYEVTFGIPEESASPLKPPSPSPCSKANVPSTPTSSSKPSPASNRERKLNMRTSPFPMPPIELEIKGAHEVASLYILAVSLQTVIDTLIATYPEIVQQDDECSRYHMAETALLAERLVKRGPSCICRPPHRCRTVYTLCRLGFGLRRYCKKSSGKNQIISLETGMFPEKIESFPEKTETFHRYAR